MDGGQEKQPSYWRKNGAFLRLLLLLAPICGIIYLQLGIAAWRAGGGDALGFIYSRMIPTVALYLWLIVQTIVGAFWLRDNKDFLGRAVHPGVWTLAMFIPYLNLLAILLLLWRLSALALREYRPLPTKP